MGEYWALLEMFTTLFIIFLGGLFWAKYRHFIKRRLNLTHYRESDSSHLPHPR